MSNNVYYEDCVENMIRNIGKDSFYQTHVYDSLKDNSLTRLDDELLCKHKSMGFFIHVVILFFQIC